MERIGGFGDYTLYKSTFTYLITIITEVVLLDVSGRRLATKLECHLNRRLHVVGLTAMAADGRSATAEAARCPYLTSIRKSLASKCNGHLFCAVTRAELLVHRRQCPGVAAVFIQVTCTTPGGISCTEHCDLLNPLTLTVAIWVRL